MSNVSYTEIKEQIKKLEREAERAKREEISSALTTIKGLIKRYDISIDDLGLIKAPKPKRTITAKASARKKRGSTRTVPPKYRDQSGNTWSGRGKKPLWLVKALSLGASLESFAISNQTDAKSQNTPTI